MSLRFQSKIKWSLAACALATALIAAPIAATQALANSNPQPQQNQPAFYGTPLRTGDMTLEDILEASPPPKKLPLQAPKLAIGPVAATPPTLAPASQSSPEGDMLMQGMKTVLQQSGASSQPALSPPQLPGLGAGPAALQSAQSPNQSPASLLTQSIASQAPAAAPPTDTGVQFQPGQEPKSLVGTTPPTGSPQQEIPTSPAAIAATAPSGAACDPSPKKWTKTCVEAGYPETFTGEISGETRANCAGSTGLQDVWISNTCAPPQGVASAAPLSAPSQVMAQAGDVTPAGAPLSAASPQGDGSCGPANGLAANIKPAGDLCNSGEASEVTGDGPWRWSCNGVAGGMTISCAAPAAPSQPIAQPAQSASDAAEAAALPATTALEDGQCGASNGAAVSEAPSGDLCSKGIASRVNGEGPYTWACSGLNGGQAMSCAAPKRTDGVCGGASGTQGLDQMPASDLCAAGYASAITGDGPWNWTCSGLYGGAPALCSAQPRGDAVCGTAALSGHREAPRNDLCSVGQASNVGGGGPWTWTCNGTSGGAPVSCAAPISVAGNCGVANGVPSATAPDRNLCAHGDATRVTGDGPWAWNCSGIAGGDTQSCTAPLAHSENQKTAAAAKSTASASETKAKSASADSQFVRCGSASELAPFQAPSDNLCAKGKAGSVTGEGPWSWTCADEAAHKTDCSTLAPAGSFGETPPAQAASGEAPIPSAAPRANVAKAEESPVCGTSSGQGLNKSPTEGLCAMGKASAVHGQGPWSWTCEKGKGKALAKVNCEAPKLTDGVCGAVSGTTQKSTPAAELCSAGQSTSVHGSGPWMWSCVGTGGGVSVSCSAASQARTRVDGACGAATTASASTQPTADLCDSGMPGTVNGNGPWTWTCSGINGGVASLCSAQRGSSPQAPPPPGPAVNGLCGDANGVAASSTPDESLCASGTVTPISGNGPWNWSCIGGNGGMTVSCTAPLQPPPPITGACGSATGVPTLTVPRSGLCAAGIMSAVNGKGPWTWSCSGTNGGGAVACVAPVAGSGAGAVGLPSLVTPSNGEAPPPQPATMMPVTSQGLVTPRLSQGSLPPINNGEAIPLTPSRPFSAPPEPSALPPVPAPQGASQAPNAMPDLPEGTEPLQPPPVRDSIKPSAALKGPDQKPIPGNHLTLPDDLSSISFTHGSENIDNGAIPTLDKLAGVLESNPGVRVTLTSYAGTADNQSPRDARRLSLTRALAVRDYLTAKGLSSARIDVRALGANVPSGDPDRVDIKAN